MIETSEQAGVAVLRMADGKVNAMSIDFCAAVTTKFEQILPARAVVLTGSGRIFSAGVDLLRLLDGGPDYIRQFLPALSTMLAAVFTHPKPVVAAINGHAMAGGCVLACAADRRIMARDAGRIGVTELLVGVPFPAAAMEIMRRATAPQYFEDAILSGATYNPPEAVARGLVHDIVDPHELLDRAIDAANTLAALSPPAFAITKRQTRGPAVERLQRADVDADIDRIWTAPDTLARIRDYVSRTLRKSERSGASADDCCESSRAGLALEHDLFRPVPHFPDMRYAAARPCSRSAMMSSLSSRPIERRTTSGPAPACTFCASVSWRCVVEAG